MSARSSLAMIETVYMSGPRISGDGRIMFDEKFDDAEPLDETSEFVLTRNHVALFDISVHEPDSADKGTEEYLYRFRLFSISDSKKNKLLFTLAAFQNTETNSVFIEKFKLHHRWQIDVNVLREFMRMSLDVIDANLKIKNISLELLKDDVTSTQVQIFESLLGKFKYRPSTTIDSPSRSNDSEKWVVIIFTKK